MPLSKQKMRERKRQDRGVKPKSNLNALQDVKPSIPGLIMEGNRIIGVEPKLSEIWKDAHPELDTWGQPNPDIDADGNIIPDY